MRNETENTIFGWGIVVGAVCVAALFAAICYGIYNDVKTGRAVLFPKAEMPARKSIKEMAAIVPEDFPTSTSLWDVATEWPHDVALGRPELHLHYDRPRTNHAAIVRESLANYFHERGYRICTFVSYSNGQFSICAVRVEPTKERKVDHGEVKSDI